MHNKLIAFYILMLVANLSEAQKNVVNDTQIWTQYSFLGRVSKKWSVYFDGVDRFNQFFHSQNTIFIRPGIAYNLTDDVSIYVGYCYSRIYPTRSVPVALNEHRPWQQLLINNKIGKISLVHRYRLEERYNQQFEDGHASDSYVFTWRMRYKLNIQFPVWKIDEDGRRTISILLSDEIITSLGKNVMNYFNQNRLFAGIIYQFSKSLNASVGYTNIFRSTSSVGHFMNTHAPTINISHKLDFRKKKGS